MKIRNPKISYDKESQVLSFEMNGTKSVDSDIQGNLVIDYDRNGRIVRINLYNFNFDAFRSKVKILEDFARRAELPISIR